jgi:hypothetical protein
MSGKRQRTTFAKTQRERARMDKAAEKRARRLARKRGETEEEDGAADPDGSLPVDSTEQSN